MKIRKISLIVGSAGFLLTLVLSFAVTFLERNIGLSLHTTVVLTRILQIICPASLGLMATENTGVIGTIIIAIIVSAEDFAIYFGVAAFICLMWKKSRRPSLKSIASNGRSSESRSMWSSRLFAALGVMLLSTLLIGLVIYVTSSGWSWYYVPASAGVIALSLLCFRAAAKTKGKVVGS
jgi:hypothetical protein